MERWVLKLLSFCLLLFWRYKSDEIDFYCWFKASQIDVFGMSFKWLSSKFASFLLIKFLVILIRFRRYFLKFNFRPSF
jgi:hypothetical protein